MNTGPPAPLATGGPPFSEELTVLAEALEDMAARLTAAAARIKEAPCGEQGKPVIH